MKDNIKKIILGIKYNRSFNVPNMTGKIFDHILSSEGSPFKRDFFNVVAETINDGRCLINQKKGDMLSIDIDNVILLLNTDKFDQTIADIKEKYFPYINNEILKKFSFTNFDRIGIVFEHKLNNDNAAIKKIAENIFNKECIVTPDNFDLIFSNKIPSKNGFIKKELIDYYNLVQTFQQNKAGLIFKFDYQLYYGPVISSSDDLEFNKFVDIALSEYKENKVLRLK